MALMTGFSCGVPCGPCVSAARSSCAYWGMMFTPVLCLAAARVLMTGQEDLRHQA
jgi:hypothetical protein